MHTLGFPGNQFFFASASECAFIHSSLMPHPPSDYMSAASGGPAGGIFIFGLKSERNVFFPQVVFGFQMVWQLRGYFQKLHSNHRVYPGERRKRAFRTERSKAQARKLLIARDLGLAQPGSARQFKLEMIFVPLTCHDLSDFQNSKI